MVGLASHPFIIALCAVLAAAGAVDRRIIGGENAAENEFPSIVSIQNAGSHICGGTLLDNTTVLTAAHCAYAREPQGSRRYSVRAGTLDTKTGGVIAAVASIKKHPNYRRVRPGSYPADDVAVIKLLTPIAESDKIRFGTLPSDGATPAVKSNAIVAGWGKQEGPADVAATLSKVQVPIRPAEDCAAFSIPKDTICAGADGKDSAKGDSGGPLIDPETGHVIGIVSNGRGFVGVYAKTSNYIAFIKENLGFTEQATQPPKPVDQQVEDHCGRSGNDKAACMQAAARCKAEVKPEEVVPMHLECVDRIQVCDGSKTEKCLEYAKGCQYGNEFPFGDLDQLAECIEWTDDRNRARESSSKPSFNNVDVSNLPPIN